MSIHPRLYSLFSYAVHRLANQSDRSAVFFCAGAFVAEHGAVLAGSGESGKQAVEVLHENGGGATFGGLFFDVGEVGFEERFAGGGSGFPGDDVGGVVACRAFVSKNSFVGIAQEPRVLVGFATDHYAIEVLQLLFDLVERLDAAVDADVQVRHLGLEAVDELVMEWRHFAVLFGRESLEPGFACMDDKDFTAGIAHGLDKVREEIPAVEIIDADAALDGYGDRDCVLHGLEAVGDDLLFFHEACAEVSVLHAVGGASAVQVDFAESGFFHKL